MYSSRCRFTHVALVGGFDAAHIAGSFARAAPQLGINTANFDAAEAWTGNRLYRALFWRFVGRRPPHLNRCAHQIVDTSAAMQIDMLIATGAAPLTERALHALRDLDVVCVNYATDDPWNASSSASWFLRALPNYDIVFTPRRANIEDLQRLGCHNVRYLPFGYDEMIHVPIKGTSKAPSHDVLFVGGADRDRVAFATTFMKTGVALTLVGSNWDRFSTTRRCWLGNQTPDAIRKLTAAAKVNLCLVRHANRDEHVMRSFEIPAIGGCMLVEETGEHREIFGVDGETVVYFRTPGEAAARARELLANPRERARLATAVQARITAGENSYGHRLATIIVSAANWAEDYVTARAPGRVGSSRDPRRR